MKYRVVHIEAVITVDEKKGTVTFCDKETGEFFVTHNIRRVLKPCCMGGWQSARKIKPM